MSLVSPGEMKLFQTPLFVLKTHTTPRLQIFPINLYIRFRLMIRHFIDTFYEHAISGWDILLWVKNKSAVKAL